jgi:hypothetical protein
MVSSSWPGWTRVLALLPAVVSAGCYDLKQADPGVALTPSADGLVSVPEVGIFGRWYAYGDQYDEPKRCLTLGRHAPETCSTVLSPEALPTFGFPNDGRLCLTGEAAPVVACLSPTEVECVDLGGGVPGPADVHVRALTDSCGCGGPTCIQGTELCYCPTKPLVPCDGDDNSNIWGAGIGLDFSLKDAAGTTRDALIGDDGRSVWNPETYGISGIAFDFSLSYSSADSTHDPNHNANLRVEFPIQIPDGTRLPTAAAPRSSQWPGTASIRDETVRQFGEAYPDIPTPSDEHPEGSPFWDAPPTWDHVTSPVRSGHNVVRFDEVRAPPQDQIEDGKYDWNETQLLGVQFHVPTGKQRDQFSFCITNLTLIRD